MKGLALVLALLPFAASAATITVNDKADTTGGSGCTLRDAIAAANTDTAQGGCAAGSGADTIEFNLALPATISLATNTQLTVTNDITVLGPGAASLTIDGNGTHRNGGTRVFEITAGTAAISGLTIKHGKVGFGGGDGGGGILIDSGATLALSNCTLFGNVANRGGGIENRGTLSLMSCLLKANRARRSTVYAGDTGSGGGLENFFGTATVAKCTFTHNSSFDGGAIANLDTGASSGASLNISDSTLNGNRAGGGDGSDGGGISNGGSVTVTNCTIENNRAFADGGISNGGPQAILNLINSTLSGNKSYLFRAGGIGNFGTASLGNSIIAHSGRPSGGDCNGNSGLARIVDLGHNLIDDPVNGCGLVNGMNGNIVGVDPDLLPLATNGGATKTMALCTGPGTPRLSCKSASPAVNAGDNSLCQGPDVNNLDQRGFLRVTGSDPTCDIGAYEAQQ